MRINLIGCGCGAESLTAEASAAIGRASLLIGSGRLLREYGKGRPCAEAVSAEAILRAIGECGGEELCVLFSGDSGFYSGARLLLPQLAGHDTRIFPGVSSVQVLAARLGRPWQDWRLCSAHGVDCDAVAAVCGGSPVFFLTGGKRGPAALCGELTAAGLGFLRAVVGEDLGTENERITSGSAAELAGMDFSPLSVLLTEASPRPTGRTPGLPDEAFLRAEKIPMTKREVRAVALAMLGVGKDELCWDIGAGTGSVSVELALQARAVWAVERDEDALALAAENRKKHGAWNLRLIGGTAPDALRDLPAPDAVFVGGSGGMLREILRQIDAANPGARICVAAVTLESLQSAREELCALGRRVEVCQIASSRSREVGGMTMMLARNPVFLIVGTRA